MIGHEEFVRIWQQSENVHEVTKACNISKGYAYIRADILRKMGVTLKYFHKKRHLPIDVSALNAIISKADKEKRQ